MICALRVNTNFYTGEVSVYAQTFVRPKKFINSLPDFPSLADEIAQPRPDMNIKVATFTVSEKSIYMIHVPGKK